MSVSAAVLYGVVNDQITTTFSPEYFSVFKQHQFSRAFEAAGLAGGPLRMQAALVGVLSTWWFGLFLGIVLSISGTVGPYAALPTKLFARSVMQVMATTFAISFAFGAAAYLIEPLIRPDALHWPFLAGIRHIRPAFAIGWWHNGAYLGALVATAAAGFRIQKQRRLASGVA